MASKLKMAKKGMKRPHGGDGADTVANTMTATRKRM